MESPVTGRAEVRCYLPAPLVEALHQEADEQRRPITKQLEVILSERYADGPGK